MTDSQRAVVESSGNIKVNAVAGSGKTTTLVEYAKARPTERILYLGFNRSVKEEAMRRFASMGLRNVQCETAHSLAYKEVAKTRRMNLLNKFRVYDILEWLDMDVNRDTLKLAFHIKQMFSAYCNSETPLLSDFDFIGHTMEPKFVKEHDGKIRDSVSQLLNKMDKGIIGMTHDFYLKKYHLKNPKLNYFDAILFDEGQDASPVMLDVFLSQSARKVIVGDTHQQIYSWRGAVNSLDRVDFPSINLMDSFRFEQRIGDLANAVIQYKKNLGIEIPDDFSVVGRGEHKDAERDNLTTGFIARTNIGLLIQAIKFMEENWGASMYFEGGFYNYTYAPEGGSLYDVLNLKNYQFSRIQDPLIKSMPSLVELTEYSKEVGDSEMLGLCTIVNKYGNDIFKIMKDIKDSLVEDKNATRNYFSTMHKAKGMEYDSVFLASDFLSREKFTRFINDELEMTLAQMIEEINLLYVAVTRTKRTLYISEEQIPMVFELLPSDRDTIIT